MSWIIIIVISLKGFVEFRPPPFRTETETSLKANHWCRSPVLLVPYVRGSEDSFGVVSLQTTFHRDNVEDVN